MAMELIGHVKNGVIVLDGNAKLPEGSEVRVLTNGSIANHSQTDQENVVVTNDTIGKILDDEEIENYKRVFGFK